MNNEQTRPTWWNLHLRKARGEKLTEAEQLQYDAEMVRQDQEAVPINDLAALKQLRAQVAALAQENAQFRTRLAILETEVQTVERALSRETRELLGVPE